ncbi:24_t:CDS:2, partial [Racocetra fulgida]
IGEEITMDCDQVTLKNFDQEISEYIILPERKTYAKRIRENMHKYLQNLNHGTTSEERGNGSNDVRFAGAHLFKRGIMLCLEMEIDIIRLKKPGWGKLTLVREINPQKAFDVP